MIRINLARRRQPSYASETSSGTTMGGGGFSRLKSSLKNLKKNCEKSPAWVKLSLKGNQEGSPLSIVFILIIKMKGFIK